MPNKGNLDPLANVAAAIVADNPELRDRMQRIINALLLDMEHTIKWGTHSEKAALTRAVMPALLRAMQNSGADASSTAQQDAYNRMLDVMRGGRGESPPTSPSKAG